MFRDFIPAKENTGSIGKGGFIDYVPSQPLIKKEVPKEPSVEKVEEVVKPTPKYKKKKK